MLEKKSHLYAKKMKEKEEIVKLKEEEEAIELRY